MYAEEADLCLRARKLGYRPTITPAAEIVHLGGRSEASPVEKTLKVTRGRVTLIRKHWSPLQKAVGLGLFRFWALSRSLGSRVFADPKGGSPDKWKTIWGRRSEWLKGY